MGDGLPRIGITASRSWSESQIRDYCAAIERAGGDPIVLRPYEMAPSIESLAGVLLSGGGDIDPSFYGQPRDLHSIGIEKERDEFEIDLARRALVNDLPVLAICRGFQLLNVVFDGSLVQHIEGHRAEDGASVRHPIDVTPGTHLAKALGTHGIVQVNSRHHQAVRELDRAATLVVSALSDDGIIEGLESPHHRWVVGVQCHPERQDEVDARFADLFTDFVRNSRMK